ncbi:MAG TPA: HAD family hydrolase [bacterium]|jgi:putative hydrolase of the HAD superfamily
MNPDSRHLIVLDLGNVLLDYRPERFAERLSRIAPHRSAEEILARYARGELKAAFERGQITEADFFAEMVQWLGCREEATPFVMDAWNDVFTITQGAEQAVEVLRQKATLWMLTDTNPTHLKYALRRFPFLYQFERTFASYVCGHMKSEPEAFAQIITAAACKPEEILFYDDLEPNVAVARSVGIDARIFHGWKWPDRMLKI